MAEPTTNIEHLSPEPATDAAGDTVMAEGEEKQELLKACRQFEFYFADSNLPYDKFMWTLHTANAEHWVPINTVASFKRMREYQKKGNDFLLEALNLSQDLEVDESKEKVRRKTEVQEPKDQFQRSVYAKGFGEETPELQAKLEEFFNKYGRTNAVRMRRDDEKKFKSSVFTEFADFSSVEAFLKADPKPSWDGNDLLIMSKEDYCEMKIKEKGITGKAASATRQNLSSGHRKGFNAFKEMAKGKTYTPKSDAPKPEIWLQFMGNKIRVHENEEGKGYVKEDEVVVVKGATLKFEGCAGEVGFREIKDPLREKFGRPPYIKYTKGEDSGLVGFDKSLSEEEVTFVKETLPKLNDKEVTWSVPPEEDEKSFQLERAQFAAEQAFGFSQTGGGGGGGRDRDSKGRGGGRGGRGGRGGGRGGKGGGGDRNREKAAATKGEGDGSAGEKRKRAVEPDGGPDVGVRGKGGPPTIGSSSKKQKVDADS